MGRALLCSALGLGLTWISLNLLNRVAWLWKILASAALGNASFAAPRNLEPSLPAATALA
jgi:hypothetical protein